MHGAEKPVAGDIVLEKHSTKDKGSGDDLPDEFEVEDEGMV